MPPIHNRPKITQTDVNRGYVVRYFIQNVSTRTVVEVDQTQYQQYRNDPYYLSAELQWFIGGSDTTTTLLNGVVVLGTKERNESVIDFYDRKMPGLRRVLRNPLEYFSGRRVVERAPFVPTQQTPGSPIVAPPTASIPGVVGAVILSRTYEGKIAALATASSDDGIFLAFDSSSVDRNLVASSSLGGYVALQTNGRLRIGVTVGGDAYVSFPNLGAISNSFVQTEIIAGTTSATTATRGSLFHRVQTLTTSRINAVSSVFGGLSTAAITEYRSNGTTAQTVNGLNLSTSFPVTLQSWASGSTAKMFQRNGLGNTTSATLNNVTSSVAAGDIIVGYSGPPNPGSWIEYSRIVAMRGPAVTVRCGQYENWYARILSDTGTFIASASAVNGTASVDLDAARTVFPSPTTLEIRDQTTGELYYYVEPDGRIWGGDEYDVAFVENAEQPSPAPTEFTIQSVERTQLGRVVAFTGTPVSGVTVGFDTSAFTAPVSASLSLSSGNLVVSYPSGSITRSIPLTVSGTFANTYVQTRLSARSTAVAAGAMVRTSLNGITDYAGVSVANGFTGTMSTLELTGSTVLQSVTRGSTNVGVPMRVQTSVRDGTLRTFVSASAFAVQHQLSSSLSTVDGYASIYMSKSNVSVTTGTFTEFMLMRSDTVTIQANLPITFTAQLRDSTDKLLAEAIGIGGVATIDCFASRIVFPEVTKIQIRNSLGALSYEIEPSERIWGGDIWYLTVSQ